MGWGLPGSWRAAGRRWPSGTHRSPSVHLLRPLPWPIEWAAHTQQTPDCTPLSHALSPETLESFFTLCFLIPTYTLGASSVGFTQNILLRPTTVRVCAAVSLVGTVPISALEESHRLASPHPLLLQDVCRPAARVILRNVSEIGLCTCSEPCLSNSRRTDLWWPVRLCAVRLAAHPPHLALRVFPPPPLAGLSFLLGLKLSQPPPTSRPRTYCCLGLNPGAAMAPPSLTSRLCVNIVVTVKEVVSQTRVSQMALQHTLSSSLLCSLFSKHAHSLSLHPELFVPWNVDCLFHQNVCVPWGQNSHWNTAEPRSVSV